MEDDEKLIDADKWKSERLCPECGAILRAEPLEVDIKTGAPRSHCPKCEYSEYRH